jgi:hypothetical protein
LSLHRPGFSRARSDRLTRTARRLASAALLAIACLVLGFGAPTAWADELAAAKAEPPPPSEPQGAIQPTDTPPTQQPSDTPLSSDPPPPADPPSGEQPLDSGIAADSPPTEGSAAEAPPSGTQRPTEASAQHGSGSGDTVTVVTFEAARHTVSDVVGLQGPLTTSEIPDVVSIAPAGADIPGAGVETGGIPVPAGSLGCIVLCDGTSGGLFGSGPPNQLGPHSGLDNTVSMASEPPPIPVPGAPGQPRGPFFNLLGGAGGGAIGFVLLSLVAVLAGILVRRPDWTTVFRLPTAMWQPSVYVPPLESPG